MSKNNPDLFDQFARLEWLLHRYHQQNHRHIGPMGDIHRGQGRILALLNQRPQISQKELSELLAIRSQSLGELLGKLERSGYITHTPSPNDRRSMDIRLTETGKEVSAHIDHTEQELDTKTLFGCLNEQEQTTLGEYLSRLISVLKQQFDDKPEANPQDFFRRPEAGD